MDNTANTEPNEKPLRWAFIKRTPVSKTTTITYLGLGNKVTVTVSIRVSIKLKHHLATSITRRFIPSNFWAHTNKSPIYR